MCENCFKYNPPADPIHQNGRKVLEVFEEKWQNLPIDEEEEHDVKPVLQVAVDGMDDDERLEWMITEVCKILS